MNAEERRQYDLVCKERDEAVHKPERITNVYRGQQLPPEHPAMVVCRRWIHAQGWSVPADDVVSMMIKYRGHCCQSIVAERDQALASYDEVVEDLRKITQE